MSLTNPYRIVVPIALLLVVGTMAGCIGSNEPVETNLPIEPSVSFGSFDEALSADGPTYEPDGLKDIATGTTGDGSAGPQHDESYPLEIESNTVQSINVTVSLSEPTPLDELTFTLLDDGGGEQDSATLTSDTSEATLSAGGDLSAGNWSVQVTGDGVETSYRITHTIVYKEESPLRVKVLEPLEPIAPGDAAFTFLLFDVDAEEPIEDADVTLESWMTEMGHGTNNEEADPVHDGNGLYVGKISPEMAGDWVVRIDYSPADGEAIRFTPPVPVVSE